MDTSEWIALGSAVFAAASWFVALGAKSHAKKSALAAERSAEAAERTADAEERALLVGATRFFIKRKSLVGQTIKNEGHATLHGVRFRLLRGDEVIGEKHVEVLYPHSAELFEAKYAIERDDIIEITWTSPVDAEGNPGRYHRRAL